MRIFKENRAFLFVSHCVFLCTSSTTCHLQHASIVDCSFAKTAGSYRILTSIYQFLLCLFGLVWIFGFFHCLAFLFPSNLYKESIIQISDSLTASHSVSHQAPSVRGLAVAVHGSEDKEEWLYLLFPLQFMCSEGDSYKNIVIIALVCFLFINSYDHQLLKGEDDCSS